ncbi:segregation and condensation protein A [Streptomyces sp. NPDC001843]|uniref:segregation and condensation protein A n=1 Tax=Streptomyces sp. NPDC001843 TaxID=3364617 RepID=UPI0036ADCCB7
MTSNDVPASGARAGRRRALGRGPGAPRVEPEPETGPERDALTESKAAGAEPVPGAGSRHAGADSERGAPAESVPVAGSPRVEPRVDPGSYAEPEAPVGGADSGSRAGAGLTLPAGVVDGDGAGAGSGGMVGAQPGPGPVAETEPVAADGVFKVRLANFEGPFDLLLQLISKHKLDVTEVALSKVTDEFMAHIRAMGPDWDLDQTTEFLVVAATLLDLKAARLLPAAEVEDEADLALLEARDLLFARLLQYRAYKQIADIFNRRLDEEARRYPRTVGLEPHHAELLPEVVISIGAEGFARLAVKAMQPRPKPQVYVDHIHAPLVSVQEQAGIVVGRLKELGEASFRTLVEDTDDTLTVVARFLALLELYREKAVALDQDSALGELIVRWTGGDGDAAPMVTDEFDRPPEEPKEEKKT